MRHAAGADKTVPETLVIKAGGKAGDPEVVGPEDDEHVGRDGVLLELKVVPDDAGAWQRGFVHLISLWQDAGKDTDGTGAAGASVADRPNVRAPRALECGAVPVPSKHLGPS